MAKIGEGQSLSLNRSLITWTVNLVPFLEYFSVQGLRGTLARSLSRRPAGRRLLM